MIPIPSGGRVWIATGHTDMRRGMQGLALQVQEGLKCDPHGGDLFIFRGRRGDLAKILWHDGIGLSPYADRGRFIWPSASDGGEDEDWLSDVANEMDIEDGVIWVYGVGEDGVMAFTDFGIDNLIDLIKIYKDDPTLLKRWDPHNAIMTCMRPVPDAYWESSE